MKYLDLAIANETIKTTDIKGKEYAEVSQRIKAFRMVYPRGIISTQLLSNENGVCVFIAKISDDNGQLLGTGHAYEKEDSSFINKTSYIENCETSAVGRALAMCGFGIDVSVASAEEVQNAIENQKVTEEDAKNYVFDFGKYNGQTFEEVLNEDPGYIKWLINNSNNEFYNKAYELLTGEVLPTEKEVKEDIQLEIDMLNLAKETDTDIFDIEDHFEVDTYKQMTKEQKKQAIKILEQKLLKKAVNEE